jgi:2-keto-4-pentenoate hydratase/2-oxohepta-3-ene-1,7-dioic acid hydratase in catechol pathway
MRLVTFAIDEPDGRLGLLDGSRVLDLAAVAAAHGGDPMPVAAMLPFILGGSHAHDLAAMLHDYARQRAEPAWWLDLAAVRLLPPVPRPPKILCLAVLRRPHPRGRRRRLAKTNTTPQVFIKLITALIAQPIRLPGPPVRLSTTRASWSPSLAGPARIRPGERWRRRRLCLL